MNLVKTVFAQAEVETINGVATLKGFEGIFENAISAILSFAAILLFILLIVGGYKYITSGGNPKSVESAKMTLTYAIGGMLLIALAFLILQFIEVFTGAPVTNFVVGT